MRQIRFGEYRLDTNAFALYRNDEAIRIGRKPLDALLFLIENRDKVVTKESLRRNIWRSERIAASTIPMCIREIRSALGDSASQPRFIQAAHGRGYRFIADIHIPPDQTTSATSEDEFRFVGRENELRTIERALRRTGASLRGNLVCVVGEAGAGKSRLVSEAIHRFSYQAKVIFTKASSTNTEFTYSIWLQALDQLAAENDQAKTLQRDIRKIETRSEIITSGQIEGLEKPETSQSIFFHTWISIFRSVSPLRPTVLVLEDIHYADRDSLLLLEQLAAASSTMPLVILATFRPSLIGRPDLRAEISAWITTGAEFVHLPPLTIDEISSLLDPFSPNRAQIASELFRLTSGNAFYATHLLRVWGGPPPPDMSEDFIVVSAENAHDIVTRQLSDLPASTHETLTAASAIGVRFPLKLLANILQLSEFETLERLEPARRAKIVCETDSIFEFRHAILRDCLYQAMKPSLRAPMHMLVAESLIDRVGKASPLEILEHQFLGHPLVSSEAICRTALEAARRLVSTYSFHEAARVLGVAGNFARFDLDESSDVRFEVMIALANALLYAGEPAQRKSVLEEAKRLARQADSPDRLARCGLAMAPDFLSIEVGTYDAETVMILHESMDRLPASERCLRARILARLSQFSRWGSGGHGVSEELAKEALTEARASRDSGAIRSALASYADSIYGPDRTEDRIQAIHDLREAVSWNGGDTYSYLLQQTRLISALLEKGEIRQVAIENEAYRRRAESTGLPQYRWYPVSTDSMLACLVGDLSRAAKLADEYSGIAGKSPDENFRQTFACQYALREIEADSSGKIVGLIEEFGRNQPAVLAWSAAHAWALWDCGREQAARECLRQFSESDILRLYREPGGTIGLAAIAEVTAYHGEKGSARRLLELLAPVSSRCATAGLGVAYFGSLSRYAGLLALSVRDLELARGLIQESIRDESRRGAQSWEAYSRLDYVRAIQGKLEINPRETVPGLQGFISKQHTLAPRARRRIREALWPILS